jgi:hypothetical protein
MKKKDDLREGAQISTRGACAPRLGRDPFDLLRASCASLPRYFSMKLMSPLRST